MKQLILALGMKNVVIMLAAAIPCTVWVYEAMRPITPIMRAVLEHHAVPPVEVGVGHVLRWNGSVSIDALRVWFAKDRHFATQIAAMCPSNITPNWADSEDGHICIAAIELREQSISRDHTMFTGASK